MPASLRPFIIFHTENMKQLLLLFCAVAFTTAVFAQKPLEKTIFSTKNGAIKGYDPVAYFTDGKPTKGRPEVSHEWSGATWHFSTAAHRDLFAANPEKYAPQYGGYCAYGWANGYAVKIEPEAWAIVEGKLYLNYDLDIQKKWEKRRAEYIQQANQNWAKAATKQ